MDDEKMAQMLLYARGAENPIARLEIPADSSAQMRDTAKRALLQTPDADCARILYRGNVLTIIEAEGM